MNLQATMNQILSRPNGLMDMIASNNGNKQNNKPFRFLSSQLSYSYSVDAVAS